MKSVPRVTPQYWLALSIASIFGANAGDFVADGLHLGTTNGLPYLALAVILLALGAKFDPKPHIAWFWAIVIVIRAAATNVGDTFHHYGIGFTQSIPLVLAAIVAVVAAWHFLGNSRTEEGYVPVNLWYWVTMFLAGTLGTVFGDYCSYALHLGNALAALILYAIVVIMVLVRHKALPTNLLWYWLIIAMIRSAGTAAGDMIAKPLDIGPSTALTGLVFVIAIAVIYRAREQRLEKA